MLLSVVFAVVPDRSPALLFGTVIYIGNYIEIDIDMEIGIRIDNDIVVDSCI